MRITYLKLVNYRRFPLRELELFEHHFTSKLLMIAGPNGSGKSSLFNELTPLPSDKNDFVNGYKEIHLEKDGDKFILICDFREKASFSFLMNGEEQNLSNNISTQRELVFFHFNLTQAIHELLTGVETFTDMSLLSRKKLFSSITHFNIDKVLENYNKLKEELKNNEVMLKAQTLNYQTEEKKLLDSNRLTTLREMQSRIKEFIDLLLEIRTHIHQYKTNNNLDAVYETVRVLAAKIKEIFNKYYKYYQSYPEGDLQRYTVDYTSKLSVVNFQLSEAYTAMERMQEDVKILALTKETNINTLREKLPPLESSISNLTGSLKIFKSLDINVEEVNSALYMLEVSLPEVLREIPTNENRKYSKARYEQLLEEHKRLLDSLTEISTEEISLRKELAELSETSDVVSCPNCQHSWSPKDIPRLLHEVKEKLSITLHKKTKTKTAVETVAKETEQLVHYFTLYKQYSACRNTSYQVLKPLWDLVDQEELIFNNPTGILTKITNSGVDLFTIKMILGLIKDKAEVEKNIQVLSTVESQDSVNVHEQLEDLQITIMDLQAYKETIIQTLDTVEMMRSVYATVNGVRSRLERAISDLFAENISYAISDILEIIESDLSKYKVSLIEIERELSQYDTVQYTLAKYWESMNNINTNIKVLTIILDELSPKNGLIAKSVSSFLNIIITNVNNTIAAIWDYRMVLKAINVEAEALNYKFKVEVEDRLEVGDIAACSKGMKEVINLSFKLILYRLLGLEGYPLWVDELCSNMDGVHTDNVIKLLQQFSISDKFSQIFIISHKENMQHLKGLEILDLSVVS